eukprot:914276-Amphidinium_carterae.1
MGSASRAQCYQNATNKVAKAPKSGSHTQQGSQIVVSSVCADSNSRCRLFHSEGRESNRSTPSTSKLERATTVKQTTLGDKLVFSMGYAGTNKKAWIA